MPCFVPYWCASSFPSSAGLAASPPLKSASSSSSTSSSSACLQWSLLRTTSLLVRIFKKPFAEYQNEICWDLMVLMCWCCTFEINGKLLWRSSGMNFNCKFPLSARLHALLLSRFQKHAPYGTLTQTHTESRVCLQTRGISPEKNMFSTLQKSRSQISDYKQMVTMWYICRDFSDSFHTVCSVFGKVNKDWMNSKWWWNLIIICQVALNVLASWLTSVSAGAFFCLHFFGASPLSFSWRGWKDVPCSNWNSQFV